MPSISATPPTKRRRARRSRTGTSTVPSSPAAEDVVAADPDDPRGTAFGAMVLPLVMSGIAAGVVLSLLIPSVGGKAIGLITFGIAGGLLSIVIIQTWMSVVPGPYLILAA